MLSPENLMVDSGRVRAGYRIGEQLSAAAMATFTILHIIGETTGQWSSHTFQST